MTDCSVDYGPLLGHKSGVVKEILFLGHKKAQIVLNHPVMETHLQVGERSGRKFFQWLQESSALYSAAALEGGRCAKMGRDIHSTFDAIDLTSGI